MIQTDAYGRKPLDPAAAAAREQTICEHQHMCRKAARKFVRPGVERADLEQVAAVGLIKAVDRYDRSANTPFAGYAWLLMIGELMHYVRDGERILRAPRRIRDMEKRWLHAERELWNGLGREPRESDVARYIALSDDDVREIREYRASRRPASIDAVDRGDEWSGPASFDRVLDRMVLRDALGALDPLRRRIVEEVHLHGLSIVEVAERLGYSRRHVTRLHRSALDRLQAAAATQASRSMSSAGTVQAMKNGIPRKTRQRGFTLIEMMIVVAIIAILVSILVPNFVRARAQAQTAACEANLKEIATALELYETDNDQYPPSGTVNSSNTGLQPYLKQVPVDPAAGPGLYYTYTVTNPDTSTASYAIVCPGTHDPGTLQNITPSTTDTHIQYSSSSGFAATNN